MQQQLRETPNPLSRLAGPSLSLYQAVREPCKVGRIAIKYSIFGSFPLCGTCTEGRRRDRNIFRNSPHLAWLSQTLHCTLPSRFKTRFANSLAWKSGGRVLTKSEPTSVRRLRPRVRPTEIGPPYISTALNAIGTGASRREEGGFRNTTAILHSD